MLDEFIVRELGSDMGQPAALSTTVPTLGIPDSL